MKRRRIDEIAAVGRFSLCTKIQSIRMIMLFSVLTTMGTIAHRAAAGGIGGGDIDTYTYHWTLPNQTGETAYGMQWLLGSYSISDIETVFEITPGGYPDAKLAYTDPLFDNRVIWSGTSTPQGESAFFGFEGTSELGDFTGNWLDENDHPLAPTFDFSPPDWDYVPGQEEYVVRMPNPTGSRYWIQRRLSHLESSISLDGAGAAEKLYNQAQLIDTSPHLVQDNSARSLELRIPAEPGVMGFLLAYDVYEDGGANPGRHLGRFLNAVSLDDGASELPVLVGDLDEDSNTDGFDFPKLQRDQSFSPIRRPEWKTEFVASSAPTMNLTTVPEPVTAIMLVLGTSVMLIGRRTGLTQSADCRDGREF